MTLIRGGADNSFIFTTPPRHKFGEDSISSTDQP